MLFERQLARTHLPRRQAQALGKASTRSSARALDIQFPTIVTAIFRYCHGRTMLIPCSSSLGAPCAMCERNMDSCRFDSEAEAAQCYEQARASAHLGSLGALVPKMVAGQNSTHYSFPAHAPYARTYRNRVIPVRVFGFAHSAHVCCGDVPGQTLSVNMALAASTSHFLQQHVSPSNVPTYSLTSIVWNVLSVTTRILLFDCF